MNVKKSFIVITSLLFSLHAFANSTCDSFNVNDPSVPECPTSGSEILPETYPIMAAVVSDDMGGAKWVKSYVMGVLKAQPEKPPQFLMPVSDETYAAVVAEIKKQAPNAQTAQKWIASLAKVPGNTWNWQQDYFESFFDKNTGKPSIRAVTGYGREGNSFQNLSATLKQTCGLSPGLDLDTIGGYGGIKSGNYGGNIEAIGDFCVLGSDHFDDYQWKKYQDNFCGGVKNAIKAPSYFLAVGHADEMFKTIPIPGKTGACNFAVGIASPRKALQLLKQNQNDRFFTFDSDSKDGALDKMQYGGYRKACHMMEKSKSNNQQQGSSVRGISLLQKLINPAHAGSYVISPLDVSACYDAKNSDFVKAYEADPEMSQFNNLVQADMDAFAADIKAKFKERHNCEPQIVELPFIYQGSLTTDAKGKIVPEMGSSVSLFPNPSNGEAVESTMILPETVNGSFKKYLTEENAKLGLKTEYIDSHFAHRNMGNLHCSSHVMRYCRPKKK